MYMMLMLRFSQEAGWRGVFKSLREGHHYQHRELFLISIFIPLHQVRAKEQIVIEILKNTTLAHCLEARLSWPLSLGKTRSVVQTE